MSWVRVCRAEAVEAGQAAPVEVGDVALVLWRDVDGRPCAMEARCPHLWTNLGYAGIVDGHELVCAAHFWRFDRAGQGSKRAATGRRDEKAEIAVFAVREDEGQVWIDVP